MREKLVNIVKAILPVLALFGAYWYIGIIPVYYVYYPKLSVYREPVTLIFIAEFILSFLAVAVGVFRITRPKALGFLFLLYQPIKLVVDLTALLYENSDIGYIIRTVTFVTMFAFLGAAVLVLKNKENGKPPCDNLLKFLGKCIPISLICLLVLILENVFTPQLVKMFMSLPNTEQYGVVYIFNNFIVSIMAVSLVIINIALAAFVQLNGATFDNGGKLISAETLKPVGVSVLFSIIVTIIWRFAEL